MYHRDSDVMSPTGTFCCRVPDASDVEQLGCASVSCHDVGDVGLSLNGNSISNNSIVLITDIGEEDDALLCTTNRQGCCADPNNRMGEWFFPSGTALGSNGAGGNIYRDRTGAESASSTSDATVRLHHRRSATGPTGLYHCVIPDSSGVDQTLFVGIYTNRENSKLNLQSGTATPPSIMTSIVVCTHAVAMVTTSLTNAFQLTSAQESKEVSFSLTCNSSGGPVGSVVGRAMAPY